MELRERLEALQEANERPLIPQTYPMSEDELKERYLDLLQEGYVSHDAAGQLGKTGRWFRGFRSERSPRYDPDFARCYEEIMAEDGPHRNAVVDRALAALSKAAEDGNVRAIEDILKAYARDFYFMRPPSQTGDINVQNLMIVMKDLPTEILMQARQALEAKRKELPPVIDA
jgi:hypothetical protein